LLTFVVGNGNGVNVDFDDERFGILCVVFKVSWECGFVLGLSGWSVMHCGLIVKVVVLGKEMWVVLWFKDVIVIGEW